LRKTVRLSSSTLGVALVLAMPANAMAAPGTDASTAVEAPATGDEASQGGGDAPPTSDDAPSEAPRATVAPEPRAASPAAANAGTRLREAEYPAAKAAWDCAKRGDRGCAAAARQSPVDTTRYRHDGFFSRVGGGLGLRGDASRATTSVELFMGGTPLPGLVIGAGYFLMGIESSESKRLIGYSALLQYYPDPRRGLHGQVLAGVTTLDGVPGPFAAAGIGWETWIEPQTSIGAVARGGYSRVLESPAVDVVFAAIAVTYTWH